MTIEQWTWAVVLIIATLSVLLTFALAPYTGDDEDPEYPFY